MRRLFGTDGVRGIANEELTAERAMQIGRAIGTVLSEGGRYAPKIIIGTDTRLSSEMLSSALRAGLYSVGADCKELGVVPTPLIAYLVKKYGMNAGVMISASHNPYQYNGIKVFGPDGFKLSDELEEQIESIVLDNTPMPRPASAEKIGRKIDTHKGIEDYIEHILSAGVNLSGLRIGIDCANGSAAQTAQKIFPALGAECYFIGSEPDGININCDCGSTSLDKLRELVLEKGLDAGVAFDGDADRCLAIDECGREVDGDFIMAILAEKLIEEGKLSRSAVVGTVMSNLGFIKFCEERGLKYISTKVGDRYVLEMMNQEGYALGGEQSGHIILRDFATTGDGQLTAVALLSRIKESGKKLSSLASVMKKYPQYTVSVPADGQDKISFLIDGKIKEILEEGERLIGDGRLVARPSGTEPVIRIMLEGEDYSFTRSLCTEIAEKIEKRLSQIK